METEIEIIKIKKINPGKIFGLVFVFFVVTSLVFFGMRAYNLTKQIMIAESPTASPYLSGNFDISSEDISSGDRRINILLLGLGGDNHPGGNLTDTMLVASIDPKNKEVAMLSIPRDLYLDVGDLGYNKINSVLYLGKNKYSDRYEKYSLIKDAVSEFLGVPIHYFGLFNFDGFKEIIDIIGGIDIDVKENFYDPYYPDQYVENYEEFFVEKGINHMDGDMALRYARSRETTSDFDRSRRQQEIIVAVKEKVLEKENYTSVKRISQIINILQDNFKTDLQLSEIKGLIDLTGGIKKENIHSKVLDDGEDGLLYADSLDGMYILFPEDSSLRQIHNFVKGYFKDPLIVEENAKISLINGTGNLYIVNVVLSELSDIGYDISESEDDNEDQKVYSQTFIYDYTNGKKKYTTNFLEEYFFGASIIKLDENDAGKDFEIVLGKDYLY